MSQLALGFNGTVFKMRVPFAMNALAKGAPERAWDRTNKVWVLENTERNRRYLKRNIDERYMSDAAASEVCKDAEVQEIGYFPEDWGFVAPPMKSQLEAIRWLYPKHYGALFHEMGLGKTFIAINVAAARMSGGFIDAMAVVCPTSIKSVWAEEIEKFSPIEMSVHIHEAGGNRATERFLEKNDPFSVLIVGSESLSSAPASRKKINKKWVISHSNSGKFLKRFLESRSAMLVADESTEFKNYKSLRTHCLTELRDLAAFRVISTGSDITQGLEDLYSQMNILDPDLIGERSFFSFRNRYCLTAPIPGAKPGAEKIVGYQNVGELLDRIKPWVHQRLKKDCLDLPDKVYERVTVKCTALQKELSKKLKQELMAEWEGKKISVQSGLEAMLRFQQISGGNMPYWDGSIVRGKKRYQTKPLEQNPKMDELKSILSRIPKDTHVIIWARFKSEIEQIAEMISHAFGPETVRTFYGLTEESQRKKNSADFQDPGSPVRFMVSTQAVGGMGQTWTAATLVIYFSNSASYLDRIQSEDRAHRKGQTNKVTYIDIQSNLPVDSTIARIIGNKADLADFVDEALADTLEQT